MKFSGVKLGFLWSIQMVGTISPPLAGKTQSSGRLALGIGIALLFLGPVLFMIQISAKLLRVPWYAPVIATLGVVLLLLAMRRKSNVWRILALTLGILFTAGQWHFLLSLSKLPEYAGPVSTGAAFPTFSTTLADGTTFNQDGLRGEQNTLMVFFRGRW
jgi:hypothetical protein